LIKKDKEKNLNNKKKHVSSSIFRSKANSIERIDSIREIIKIIKDQTIALKKQEKITTETLRTKLYANALIIKIISAKIIVITTIREKRISKIIIIKAMNKRMNKTNKRCSEL
jgi:hypothetical protein